MNKTSEFTFYVQFHVLVAGESLRHLSPSCYFKFQLYKFALRDSVRVWDMEHWQRLTRAGEENKEHWSAGWGIERKRRRGHRRQMGSQGRPASYSCVRVTLPSPSRYRISCFIEHSDIYSARSSERESLRRQRHLCKERSGQFLFIPCNFTVGKFSIFLLPPLIYF